MTTKSILLFVAGAVVGGTVTYFSMKKYFEDQKYEEMQETKEHFKTICSDCWDELHRDKTSQTEENEQEMVKENLKMTKNNQKQDRSDVNYEEIIEKMNYGEFFNKNKQTQEAAVEESKLPDVFTISGDAYADESVNSEKLTLYYYEPDGVFLQVDTEEVLTNGLELIGEENIDKFGEYEEDVLYVRNVVTDTDYEVIRMPYAFAESEYFDGDPGFGDA